MVKQFEALARLHDEYGLFKDDLDFIDIYYSTIDDNKKLLDAHIAIEADLFSQLDGVIYDVVDSWALATTMFSA